MSDFGDFGDCDCDCGDCGDCGDCDCGSCDCCDGDCCDDCCECGKCDCDNCFKCECCNSCGGDNGCCGSEAVNDDDSLDYGGVHRRGCGWSFCFIITDGDCCDYEGRRRRRNLRRYELERRRQMESQGPSVTSTVNGAPGNGVPSADSVLPANKEPSDDNTVKPSAITTQPPSYEEATQKEPVVTSQPV